MTRSGRTIWNVQMAASVISIIPLLVIFLVFQRRFVEGITAGASTPNSKIGEAVMRILATRGLELPDVA